MNRNSKKLDIFYSSIAKELDLSVPVVKHTVDTMFNCIRQELKRPSKKGILLHNFCAINAKPKSLKGLIERRKPYMVQQDIDFWENYLNSITKK